MAPTRRATMTAIAAGAASTGVPTGAARLAGQDGQRDESPAADGVARVEWTISENGDYAWDCYDAALTPEGNALAACSLKTEDGFGPAARLVEIDPAGETAVLGTIGDPDDESVGIVVEAIEPAVDEGYVAAVTDVELEDGEPTGTEIYLRYVSPSGTVEWEAGVPGVDGLFFPDLVDVATVDDGYVAAIGSMSGVASGFVGFDAEGEVRWRAPLEADVDVGVIPQTIATTDDGELLFAGTRAVRQDSSRHLAPLIAKIGADGSTEAVAQPSVDGGRFVRSLVPDGDRLLVVGDVVEEAGEDVGNGWAMAIEEVGAEPTWSKTLDAYGIGLLSADRLPGTDVTVLSGRAGGAGRVLAGTDAAEPTWTHDVEAKANYESVLPLGDGSAYVVGFAGSGADRTLEAMRLSTPLPSDGFTVEIDPVTAAVGDQMSLSVDADGFDPSLLDASWTVDGEEIATGFEATATFESAGAKAVQAEITTADGRNVEATDSVDVTAPESSTSPEHPNASESANSTDQTNPADGLENDTGPNGSSGGENSSADSDSLPGFGLLAAGGGLAGAALYERLRGEDEAE